MLRLALLPIAALLAAALATSLPAQTAQAAEGAHLRQPPPARYRPAPYRSAPRRLEPIHSRTGLYLGLGGSADFVISSNARVTELIRSGGGFHFFGGLRMSRFLAVEAGYRATSHEVDKPNGEAGKGLFQAFNVDAKIFLLPSSRRLEPFIEAGASLVGFYSDGLASREMDGFGLNLGGGVDIRLSKAVTLGTRALYRAVFVDDYNSAYFGVPPESAHFNLVSGEVNLQFHF
jgi:hypothetical protein